MNNIQQQTIQLKRNIYDLIKEECINRGYTYKTIKSYSSWTKQFLKFADKLDKNQFEPFITYLSNKKKVKPTTRNNAISALVFIFQECLKHKLENIPIKSKIPSSMPEVLSKEKILMMISSVRRSNREYTLKHKLMIELPYSSGLRLAELINLKVFRLDFSKGRIFVKEGKGRRDRMTVLSEQTAKDIKEYLSIRKQQSNPYLFDKGSGYHISGRTVWKVLKRQAKECNIAQRVHPHLLRDSFATHLLEQGVDSRYIQRLLGHIKLETTTKYTRVADVNLMKIKSPLDLPC